MGEILFNPVKVLPYFLVIAINTWRVVCTYCILTNGRIESMISPLEWSIFADDSIIDSKAFKLWTLEPSFSSFPIRSVLIHFYIFACSINVCKSEIRAPDAYMDDLFTSCSMSFCTILVETLSKSVHT